MKALKSLKGRRVVAHPGCWSRIFPYAIYRNSMLYSCYLFDSTKTGAFVWLDDLSLF